LFVLSENEFILTALLCSRRKPAHKVHIIIRKGAVSTNAKRIFEKFKNKKEKNMRFVKEKSLTNRNGLYIIATCKANNLYKED